MPKNFCTNSFFRIFTSQFWMILLKLSICCANSAAYGISYRRSVATIQVGHDMEKTYFPPPSAHLSGGRWFKPRDPQKKFWRKNQLIPMLIFPLLFICFRTATCLWPSATSWCRRSSTQTRSTPTSGSGWPRRSTKDSLSACCRFESLLLLSVSSRHSSICVTTAY